MRNKLFIFYVFVLFFNLYLHFTNSTLAAENFATDSTVTYSVDASGKTLVSHDITIENLNPTLYSTTYQLTLENIDATNIRALDAEGKPILFTQNSADHKLNIKLTFPDDVIGNGAKRRFVISYENSNFAVKTGEVWEISIPRLENSAEFRNYIINLEVPYLLGQEAYISPQPVKSSETAGTKIYTFNKEIISESGVTAGFGQFQVFSFNLTYHLENPLNSTTQTEIAIPPDTAFQKVYLTKLDPKPQNVSIDADGNYLAIYKLTSRQRLDVNAEGMVQIFAGFRPFPQPTIDTLTSNLKPTTYWQSDDPQIKQLALNLATPEAIYNYVVKTLKYNYARVAPNIQRMGAINSLNNPDKAVSMEFTDLFIALCRAAGIPAREINGYAYTENKEFEPISLVADVLHSWPEYYDKNRSVWIPVDPTWGNTSGVDYFSKLDLRHFAFVIHGALDKEPYSPGSYKLGPNPQKDVYISVGKLPQYRNSIPKLKISTIRNLPFFDMLYSVQVENPGPASMYSFYVNVYYDDKLNSQTKVALLPPYSENLTKIKIPYSLLGKNMPDKIKVVVNESQIVLLTNKTQVIINSLVMLFAFIIFVIILLLAKLKKHSFERIFDKISRIYAKIFRRFTKNRNNKASN